MPTFVLILVVILSLSVAITATTLAIFALRKWRKLYPRDKTTRERPQRKKKDYLRFQARAYLTIATGAMITVFNPEIAWLMLLIAVGCASFVGPMWYQYDRVGKQARRLKKVYENGELLPRRFKWEIGRRYTWVVPTTTLIACTAIGILAFMWGLFAVVSWVWWLALIFSCITIPTMMFIHWRATTRPKDKSWKWVLGAVVGLVLILCVVAITIIAGVTSADASDELPPPGDEQTINVIEESEKYACDVSISANIPHEGHKAKYAFAINTQALYWAGSEMNVLPDGVKAHGELQEDQTGCLSEKGKATYNDLVAITTDAELEELWIRGRVELCEKYDCSPN